MIIKQDKNKIRIARHTRIRHDIVGTAKRPRLNVYRSESHIYAQIIDDENQKTLIACNTLQKDIKPQIASLTKKEQARFIGKIAGEKALKLKIKEVIFDRGGYLYTGRVKELADGAREAGLKF